MCKGISYTHFSQTLSIYTINTNTNTARYHMLRETTLLSTLNRLTTMLQSALERPISTYTAEPHVIDGGLLKNSFVKGRQSVQLWFKSDTYAGFSISDTDHYICDTALGLEDLVKSKMNADSSIGFVKSEASLMHLYLQQIGGEPLGVDPYDFRRCKYTVQGRTFTRGGGLGEYYGGDRDLYIWCNGYDNTSGIYISMDNFVCADSAELNMLLDKRATNRIEQRYVIIVHQYDSANRTITIKKIDGIDCAGVYTLKK